MENLKDVDWISVDDDSTQNKTLEVMINKFYDSI